MFSVSSGYKSNTPCLTRSGLSRAVVCCSSAQELLLGALRTFTRYEIAVQSNGVDVVGPFSGTVEESTLSDRESLLGSSP